MATNAQKSSTIEYITRLT